MRPDRMRDGGGARKWSMMPSRLLHARDPDSPAVSWAFSPSSAWPSTGRPEARRRGCSAGSPCSAPWCWSCGPGDAAKAARPRRSTCSARGWSWASRASAVGSRCSRRSAHRLVGRERWLTPAVFLVSTALGREPARRRPRPTRSASPAGGSPAGAARSRARGGLRAALVPHDGRLQPADARLRQLAVVEGIFHLLNGRCGWSAMALRWRPRPCARPGRTAGLRGLLRDPGALPVALGAAVGVAVLGLGVPEVVLAAGLHRRGAPPRAERGRDGGAASRAWPAGWPGGDRARPVAPRRAG